ncbi:biliverdin-producing heme oxygenase [uncultured Sphingomonas sp.]|uniref:biliverdin-producing heme oxygenase n=1 Tax=uncultured Sphingomonas sp. TaxID=158754 RepID=UPI0025DE2AA3|nr:biliverdin-producing heme oxygenase [uncultured Sphingomonas sp.]
MTAHLQLRSATSAKHDEVDAAFGQFDLADPWSYAAFLRAHARILPALETALAQSDAVPDFAPRTLELVADLAALGEAPPPLLPAPALDDEAAALAAMYVVEGSRLGGVMLSRQIPATLPRAYLSAAHRPGGWRNVLAHLDAGWDGSTAWMRRAIATAESVFDLYAQAARLETVTRP